MIDAPDRPSSTGPKPTPTLLWHVCPRCGLAGWAREGFGYCRLHSERPDEPFAALVYPKEPKP
jgi:hypothetical protein